MWACACSRCCWPGPSRIPPFPGSSTGCWVPCTRLPGGGSARRPRPWPRSNPNDDLAEQLAGVHVVVRGRRVVELEHPVDDGLEVVLVEEGVQRLEVGA